MNNPTGAPSMTKMVMSFLGLLLLGHIILAAIGYFFPKIEMPSSIGIVFLTVAAISAGQIFAKDASRAMTSGEKFKFAVLATILAMVLAICALWAMFAFYGVPFTLENVFLGTVGEVPSANEMQMFALIGAGIGILVSLLVCYFGSGMGAKMYLKQMAKLAAKGK